MTSNMQTLYKVINDQENLFTPGTILTFVHSEEDISPDCDYDWYFDDYSDDEKAFIKGINNGYDYDSAILMDKNGIAAPMYPFEVQIYKPIITENDF